MDTPTMLPGKNGGPAHPLEWFFRIGILGGLAYGGMLLFNAISPTVITFLMNLWIIIPLAVVTLMVVMYVIQHPTFLLMSYNNLCRKLTNIFIDNNPIAYMKSYVELLIKKLKGLGDSLVKMEAKKEEMERKIEGLNKDAKDKYDLAMAAKKMGDEQEASHQGSMMQQDKDSIDLFMPLYQRLCTGIEFLEKLQENWKRSIEQLQFTIARKEDEWKVLKEFADACNMASEFASGNTQAQQIYNASIVALEQKVTTKLGYIDQFQKSTKGTMKTMDLEKAVMDEKGMAILDNYMKDGKLFLQDDWKQFELKPSKDMFKPGAAATHATAFASSFQSNNGNGNGAAGNKYADTL